MKFFIKKVSPYYVIYFKYKNKTEWTPCTPRYFTYSAAKKKRLILENTYVCREDLEDFK